jgi:glycosyltransferase involved in cell wall biosynthesis
MARVDILTPVHNTPIVWVRQALESVIQQTFPDWKLILVNDGSDAQTTVELEALIHAFSDRRITYIHTENRGPSAARNAAIRSSDSDYLAILDSDDAWYPRKLEIQVPYLDSHPEIALVHANHDLLWADGSLRPGRRTVKNFNHLTPDELLGLALRNNIVGHGESLFRRSAAEAVGLYDEDLRTVEDKDLLLRMLLNGSQYYYQDETVYLYRWHSSNSTKNIQTQLAGRLKLVAKMDALLEGDPAWAHLGWTSIRRDMSQNAWRQAVEGHIDQGEYWNALRYVLPNFCGWSSYSVKLALRAIYGLVVKRASSDDRRERGLPGRPSWRRPMG